MIVIHVLALIFLFVISIIDFGTFHLKKGSYIPSILTDGFLITMFIAAAPSSLFLGALGGLLSLFLLDTLVFEGLADVKCFVAGAMTLGTMGNVISFTLILLTIGFVIKFIVSKSIKNKEVKIPFVPFILVAYLLTVVLLI